MGKTIIFRDDDVLDMRRVIVTVEYPGVEGEGGFPTTTRDYETIGLDGLIEFINEDLKSRKRGYARVIAVREETDEEVRAAMAKQDKHMADE